MEGTATRAPGFRRPIPGRWGLCGLVAGLLMASGLGCRGSDSGHGTAAERTTGPSIIELRLPSQVGEQAMPLRRPAVEFNHEEHAKALAQEGCEACHQADEGRAGTAGSKPLDFQILADLDPADRDGAMDAFHGFCLGCHEDRAAAGQKTGAVTCGECHAERGAAVSSRGSLTFDRSLHHRHVAAHDDKCETCHHVAGEGPGKRVYKKGAEESCRGCHGETEQEGRPSLRVAVHQDCVGCHLERRAQPNQASGPVACQGCHDSAAQADYEPVDHPARLVVEGQPDGLWLQAKGAKSNLVGFDHEAHEQQAASCSTCHHERLTKCSECHTLAGSAEGDMVTLEEAYHRRGTEHSCVGCHEKQTQVKDCAGCHDSMAVPPSAGSCVRCHNGPPAGTQPLPAFAYPSVDHGSLPPASDDFPETVVIDGLAADYGPSTFAHKKIVEHMFRTVSKNKLAARFHGSVETFCAGCHHESPVGTRPPPCRSCHDKEAAPTSDKPGLKAAYHRQCLGCHQQMAIEPQGCTKGCHEPAKPGAEKGGKP